jgi:hypothetical protein
MNALLISTLATALLAQQGEPAPRQDADHEAEHAETGRRMLELFAEVERRLDSIDRLLADAAAGDVALDADADAGIDRLLERSRDDGSAVVRGIDEILSLPST